MRRRFWWASLALLLGLGPPAAAATPVLQLILTPKIAEAAALGPLVNCFSITPDGVVVVGDGSHLWAVGATGALPLNISGLTSFAFMPGGILLGVSGRNLVYLDTDGTLKTLFVLPEPGMSVTQGQGNTLILFGPETPGQNGIYLVREGRQAIKIISLPASITDVAALNGTLLFISDGALYEVLGHHLRLVAAEPGAGFTSVTANPTTGDIYLADSAHVVELQHHKIIPISNNFAGLLRWTQGGLIIFSSKNDALVRLRMPS
jgi:hypothetical protein